MARGLETVGTAQGVLVNFQQVRWSHGGPGVWDGSLSRSIL